MNVNGIGTKHLTNYENLANAIIEAGAEDYRKALRKLTVDPDNEKAAVLKQSVERFFRSQWYIGLTKVDGEYLLKRICEECRR